LGGGARTHVSTNREFVGGGSGELFGGIEIDVLGDFRQPADFIFRVGRRIDVDLLAERFMTHDGFMLAGFSLADQTYGFAFPAGSPLGAVLDVSIVELNRSGRIHAITERTFGRTTFDY